jgi:hypothetical protein
VNTTAPTDVAAVDKYVSGLRARLALAGGYVLNAIDSNGRTVWIVSRWGLQSREFETLAEVERFLELVGAKP